MPIIARTDQGTILKTIRDRVMSKVPDATDKNTWVDDEPLPASDPAPYKLFFTVAPGDSQFSQERQIGGSFCQVFDESVVAITVANRFTTDQPKRLDEAMLNTSKGILTTQKKPMLQAILTDDGPPKGPWLPVDQDGNQLFNNEPKILSILKPTRHRDWPILFMTFLFVVDFTWDL